MRRKGMPAGGFGRGGRLGSGPVSHGETGRCAKPPGRSLSGLVFAGAHRALHCGAGIVGPINGQARSNGDGSSDMRVRVVAFEQEILGLIFE